jgi:hypothetical protein
MLERQDGSDSPERNEAHHLAVRDDEDKRPGRPTCLRHPLDDPEMPLRRVDAVPDRLPQASVDDRFGFVFAHHAYETVRHPAFRRSGRRSISAAATRH